MGSLPFVAMGAILSFFFPWEDTGPDTRDTKEDETSVKEVDSEKPDIKKTPEISDTKVTAPKITEEAMEEADYEVVETSDGSTLTASSFPRTPQNSFANLPSLPSAGQLDDGFEVISQRSEESTTSLLNVDNTAAVVENKEAKEDEEDESPIANLKSGVEALLTDLSASAAAPEQEEESVSTTTASSVVTEETSTTTTIVQEVQSIGEVEDNAKEATNTEETMES